LWNQTFVKSKGWEGDFAASCSGMTRVGSVQREAARPRDHDVLVVDDGGSGVPLVPGEDPPPDQPLRCDAAPGSGKAAV
jgi:hypothetical protein